MMLLPLLVAALPANDYWVYVAAESADEVYSVRFDGAVATVEGVIEVGYQPPEIEGPHGLTVSPDGAYWFVTMAHGKPYGTLYKYETGTNRLVGECELGLFPATMEISAETGLLYCVNFDLHGDMSPSTVSVVDPEAMVEVTQTTTGPMPHGSRLSPDGLRHYSCAMMSGELFELDAESFAVRRVLDLDPRPPFAELAAEAEERARARAEGRAVPRPRRAHEHGRGPRIPQPGEQPDAAAEQRAHSTAKPTWVHPHPTLPRLYVCLNGAATVVEVDTLKWAVVRRFHTGKGPYNVAVTPDGTQLVVTYKSEGNIGIWDLASGVERLRAPTTRKVSHGVVISPDSRYAFVSAEGIGGEPGTLDVYDLAAARHVTSVDLGLQCGGIAFWKVEPAR
jgi:DNA-binding beta-propeller fold protein YncE